MKCTPDFGTKSVIVYNQEQTAKLLDWHLLVDALKIASRELISGEILNPERMVVPLPNNGVLLSMPAVAADIATHKLVNVQPANKRNGLPTIHGQVSVFNAQSGEPRFILDGPEVTGRRTAAVSMLALETFMNRTPESILIIGAGTQAAYHIKAINALYPDAKVWVCGIDYDKTSIFCEANKTIHYNLEACAPNKMPDTSSVITLTTSNVAVYNERARTGKLIIGVGAFTPQMCEIGKTTLAGSDLYADDPVGARHEAGDYIQAEVVWEKVRSLASALDVPPVLDRPVVFKSVGTGAWDLAACRVANAALGF